MDIEKLVIIPGDGTVGREVARLGVALGHEIVSISPSGKAPNAEPWTHGVTWIKGDPSDDGDWVSQLEGAFAVVVTDAAEARVAVNHAGSSHTVVAVEGAGSVANIGTGAVASFHAITHDESSFSDGAMIRVEQLGMALLRIALEEHRGVLDHDRLVFLGDAVMIQ